jgi:hypothetical protein
MSGSTTPAAFTRSRARQAYSAPNSPRASPAAHGDDVNVPNAPVQLDDGNVTNVPVQLTADQFSAILTKLGTSNRSQTAPVDLSKLPKFKGELRDSEYAPNWLAHIEAIYTAAAITSDTVKLNLLFNCFPAGTNSAVWWNKSKSSFTSFSDFTTAFLDRFKQASADEDALLVALQNHEQREYDSVSSYHASLVQKYERLERIGCDFTPKQRVSKFIFGLRKDIRSVVRTSQVVASGALSFEAAVNLALNAERSLPKPQRHLPRNPPVLRQIIPDKRGTWCFYCESPSHNPSDCKRIAERKRKGTWRDQLPAQRT